MKKALVVIFLTLAVLVQPCFSGSLRSRITNLENEVAELKRQIEGAEREMAIIPTEDPVEVNDQEPTLEGEGKVVGGTLLVLDDCDAATQWSVHSGAGVTVALDNGYVLEGTGSIKVTIPAGITAIVKATKSSGSWDISTHKYLKVGIRTSTAISNANLHFGEAAYNDQNMGVFDLSGSGHWAIPSWDISAIAAASRNGVTIFAVTLPNTSGASKTVYLDYVFADPGYSKYKCFIDGAARQFYPKVYQGTYTGDGTDPKTITIARKGTPAAVLIWGNTATYGRPYLWLSSMGADLAVYLGAAGTGDSGVITEVGDCYFKVSGNYGNKNTVVYHYLVLWAD